MKLRDHLAWIQDSESNPETGFNMGSYFTFKPYADTSTHNCGSSCCIAGHAILLSGKKKNEAGDSTECREHAKNWLGLTDSEAKHLFYGYFSPISNIDDISLEEGIAQLDRMIATGEV